MARTRFQRADQADSDCTPADGGNKPLLSTQTGGNETVTFEIPAQTMNDIIHSFTMAAGDPGGAEDLGASSLFRMQLDITVIDATITCKIAFHGVNASCATQGNAGMDEGDFSSMGLNLGTTSWDPPISDRYQGRVLATNSEGHDGADGTLTLRTNNANAFYEIPDVGGVPEDVAMLTRHPDLVEGRRRGPVVPGGMIPPCFEE